jgi:hypothetical protein
MARTPVRHPPYVVLPASCWRQLMHKQGEPRGPNELARACEAQIAELEARKATLLRSERRPINQQLHTIRQLLAWCKTRAGYVETPEDLGLL